MDTSKVTRPPLCMFLKRLMPIGEVPIDLEALVAIGGLDFPPVSGALRRCADTVSDG